MPRPGQRRSGSCWRRCRHVQGRSERDRPLDLAGAEPHPGRLGVEVADVLGDGEVLGQLGQLLGGGLVARVDGGVSAHAADDQPAAGQPGLLERPNRHCVSSAALSDLPRSRSTVSCREAAKNIARADFSPSTSSARIWRFVAGRSSSSSATVSIRRCAWVRSSTSARCAVTQMLESAHVTVLDARERVSS
jgi:hypothetical protein